MTDNCSIAIENLKTARASVMMAISLLREEMKTCDNIKFCLGANTCEDAANKLVADVHSLDHKIQYMTEALENITTHYTTPVTYK